LKGAQLRLGHSISLLQKGRRLAPELSGPSSERFAQPARNYANIETLVPVIGSFRFEGGRQLAVHYQGTLRTSGYQMLAVVLTASFAR
jgi:hypothetical protein